MKIKKKNMTMKNIVGLVIGVIILILFLILNPIVRVSAGERGVVLNWGAVSENILGEGIHWIIPVKQGVKKLDVKIQKEETGSGAASKDLQTVNAKVALNYHLNPEKVNNLWQNVGSQYKERIIDPAIQEAIKAITAKYTAEELITKRQLVKEDIKNLLMQRLAVEFIIVDEFSIVDFNFSDSFNVAIEAKVTAEQNALAAKNKLEQSKYEAEQRIAQARGEAEAIKIQAEAIQNQGGAEYVNLKAVERWDGKLPVSFVPGSAIPFLNLDK